MEQSFDARSGLRIAIEMERRGGEFYRRAARVVKSPDTAATLDVLAQDEAIHQRDFERLLALAEARAGGQAPTDLERSAYLSAVASDLAFPGGLMSLAGELEDVKAILRYAIQSELDAIEFYGRMVDSARQEEERVTFQQIRSKEMDHLKRLQSMLDEVNRTAAD
ncbi:MAG: ferritin family protein [Clostridiales bacterium]|nr:ferritin family protein [Clostridiales bacterium]